MYDTYMNISMIAFLGNKGSSYSFTRHNSGWLFFQYHFSHVEQDLVQKFHGLHGQVHLKDSSCRVLLPHTYMNESGVSVGAMVRYFSIPVEELLVVHDDLELPFAKVVLQKGGGLAGHNGLKSIANHLSSKEFLRLRIGISRPKTQGVASYVLSRFSPIEEPLLPIIFDNAMNLICEYMQSDNKKSILPLLHSLPL